jgi:hypothetical protein
MNYAAVVASICVLTSTAFAQSASTDTPAPATNQCWDQTRGELRDKTPTTMTGKKQETADQSPGAPAPRSGNTAGSGLPRNANAQRPAGTSDC